MRPSGLYQEGITGQSNYSSPHKDNDFSGYQSDSSISVSSNEDLVVVKPTERSEHDGYNQYKTPSGNVRQTSSGQMIELFEGTHEGLSRDALGCPVWG